MKKRFNTIRGRGLASALLCCGGAGSALSTAGADIDISKLPPPATVQVEFTRDIKPIFEASCFRCHGPEKPKSGFRLDNRAAALKGGDDGVDIIPGKSAASPLIHYVARLVEDKEMPPDGKGKPLTSEQIGLLRAWIDQGVKWDTAAPTNSFDVSVSPMIGGTFVSGDNNKFREHYWRRDGVDGGVERFEMFEQVDANTRVLSTGHASLDDYKLTLNVDRTELGFVHSGWQQYRKYYDDTGGYLPGPEPYFPESLGSDLYLDVGKAWIDFGLTLPHWPRMVLGYEYDYRRGNEATTVWGSNLAADPRNLAPNSRHLDEVVHVIKFDFDAEVKGVAIEDRFRGEFYSLNSHYTNLAARASVAQNVSDENSYFQGANSIRLEKKFNDWLFGSGGYFYSQLHADDSFSDETIANDMLYLATVPKIELSRESHLFNLNGYVGPFDGLTILAGAQSEWTRQHGFGSGLLNKIAYVKPPGSNLEISPAMLYSDYDQNTVTEMAGLRYTKIPYTSLFADARLRQETIGQSEAAIQPDNTFLENPTDTSQLTDFRAGFSTSPWQRATLSAHYRRYENDSRYKTNDVPQPVGGYPGFISSRDLITQEVETKLVLRVTSWLKTTLSYQIVSTEYNQVNRPAYDFDPPVYFSPGGALLAGKYDSHIYSLGMTLTPIRRLALTTTFSYQDTSTTTENAGIVPPYEGDVYSALVNALYIINSSTDFSVNYSFSRGDYAHGNFGPENPPPFGIEYQQHAVRAALSRRINKNITTKLQYGYYHYDEPSLLGVNDYNAHSVFAVLTCRLP